ncbi:MAG TPA: galactokinase [Bryobacteraceae bacterium]|nr:galactokinase [Bryobacteraceae bacterium]
MNGGFEARYGKADGLRVFRAPGRVNLIGEHTDYNLGFVLPIALHMATYVGTAPAASGELRVYSEHADESVAWPVVELPRLKPRGDWTDYVAGVAQELIKAGYPLEPANLYIRSTVPEGSGLSSSAALEVSTALALLGGRAIDRVELAKLCRRAEVDFVGMPCGIMDQFISVFGREHAAVRIDCRSLEHEAVALPDGIEILAVNSMVKHALGTSAYKQRTVECATAVGLIAKKHPQVQSLRDVTVEMFEGVEAALPAVIAQRARHVVTENARVEDFVAASVAGHLERMGALFVASHRSLQHDYEVSCEELDFLVDHALAMEGVYGARMTGGGFGGCTVNLMRPEAAGAFRDAIAAAYQKRFGVVPQIYPCRPSAGAGEVTNLERIPAPGELQ